MMTPNETMNLRELIKASAGSGKTYQLTDRFIYLMLMGSDPASIVALTFSRKAAGEFFDAILRKLAEAAKDPKAREALELKFGLKIPSSMIREKISSLLQSMNRLTLGTLDSFFFSMLSSAPLEYGLAVGFDLMDEASIRERWSDCLKRCFEESLNESTLLIDAFSRARKLQEDREFFPWVMELALSFRDLLDQCPNSDAWGAVEDLWPDSASWKQIPEGYDLSGDSARCRELLQNQEIEVVPELSGERVRNALENAIREFETWVPGANDRRSGTVFAQLLKASMDGHSSLSISYYGKDYRFSGEWVSAVRRMSGHIIREELRICGIRTKGMHALLSKVVGSYRKLVLEKGGITFSDLPMLLNQGGNELARMNREYRLDRKYLHWMLDEFQDTSPIQWGVIEPLLDEVLYDPEEQRMFFCVGDQKQAIYGWRGGDSRLFGYLEERFSDRLKIDELNLSWRSGQDVLNVVNQVFGSGLEGAGSVGRWSRNWMPHRVSPKTEKLSGNVVWWTAKKEEERFRAIAELLRTIDPVGRGWTCAVLTQKRKTARAIVDFLRKELPGMPIEDEVGSLPANDNGFSQLLLSLLKASVHPTDEWAIGHLEMSPLLRRESRDLSEILEEVRKFTHERGLAAFIREWGGKALTWVEEEARPFAIKRLSQTFDLARSFDRRGQREVDLFLQAAQSAESSRGAMETSVRAMTIHGSKGLTFDMVIMPELGGNSLRSVGGRRSGNGVELYGKSSSSGIGSDWVLSKPKKIIQESDPYLSGLLNSDQENAAFESLCKFYVGMTRPARALYLFSEPYEPKSKSENFVRLLAQSLADFKGLDPMLIDQVGNLVGQREEGFTLAYHGGSPDWWEERTKKTSNDKKTTQAEFEDLGLRKFRGLPKFRPSEKTPELVDVDDLISFEKDAAKSLGSEAHALFEKIEWWEKGNSMELWLRENAHGFSGKSRRILTGAFADAEVRRLFEKPEGKFEVWREKSFVLQMDKAMVQGVFDRVVLYFSQDGESSRAEIIDFKTDRLDKDRRVEDLIARHQAQLESYRLALMQLTGLPSEKISLILLFTSLPKVHRWI